MAEIKTNVMRILEKLKISYIPHEYPHGVDAVDGITVASYLNESTDKVFKTLVTRGSSKKIFVFVIPVSKELDLKKAAKSVGEKSVSMIHVNEINELTGYIRGGCSPVGMKKLYKTVFDSSALLRDKIIVSAGRIGYQVEVCPEDLRASVHGDFSDIIVKDDE